MDDDELNPPGWANAPLGGTWRPTREEAFAAAFEERKKAGKSERQFFRVVDTYIWGENPVREYKVVLEPLPGAPGID